MTKKQILLYGIFGILTTAINVGIFILLSELVYYMIANIIAWSVAVLFAFFTNKYFVFSSKNFHTSVWMREMWEFFLARSSTGIVDFIGMYVFVTCMYINEFIAKVAVNIFVIISNYLLSKYWIFRKC